MTKEQQEKLRRALYNAKFTTDADDENPFVGIYFQDLLGIIANYGNSPHWISVEDELPKVQGKYMFRLSNGDMCYETYYPKLKLVANVTHWMPIVPPRKEEKK